MEHVMKQAVSAAWGGIALSLCASTATAMHLNPNGLGQVLVYPYYTVNGGYSSFFTIANDTSGGKAVKVRLLEGYNGRDVMDFNLYLSPHDYWAGVIVPTSDGGAAVFSTDNSCTVPKLPTTAATARLFTTSNFDGSGAQGKDGGPTGVARTREGHIEIIEMGALTASSPTLKAVTHSDGVPFDCASVVNAWAEGGQWTADPTQDIGPPSGGLFGNAMILDVSNGIVFSYSADAIAQFYAAGDRGEHSRPDALTPNISSGTSRTADLLSDDGPLSLTYARPLDAASALFMAEAIQNEYWSASGIAANSEWVVTYPTKRFYVDPYFASGAAQPPFDAKFSGANGGTSFSQIKVGMWDREEKSPVSFPPFGAPAPTYGLSYETQVVTFNQGSSGSLLFDSGLVSTGFTTSSDNGWLQILLGPQTSAGISTGSNHQLVAATNGDVLLGQPVAGFWAFGFANGDINGQRVLANYSALYRHKMLVGCKHADGTACS